MIAINSTRQAAQGRAGENLAKILRTLERLPHRDELVDHGVRPKC